MQPVNRQTTLASVELLFHPFESDSIADETLLRKAFAVGIQITRNGVLNIPPNPVRESMRFGLRNEMTQRNVTYEARTELCKPERKPHNKVSTSFCVTFSVPILPAEEASLHTVVFTVLASQNDLFRVVDNKPREAARGSCSLLQLYQLQDPTVLHECGIPLVLSESSAMSSTGPSRNQLQAHGIQTNTLLRPMSLVLRHIHGEPLSTAVPETLSLLPVNTPKPPTWLEKFSGSPGLRTYKCSAFSMPMNLKSFTKDANRRSMCCEHIFESELSFRIPSSFLQHQLVRRAEALNEWIALSKRTRAAQFRFESLDEAALQGCFPISVRVNSGQGLAQTHRNAVPDAALVYIAHGPPHAAPPPAPEGLDDEKKTSGLPSGGKFLQHQISKFGNFRNSAKATVQRAAAGELFPARETGKLCSPFVKVFFEPSQGERRLLGATNTEYRTDCPVFGSNANRRLCEHSRPRTAFSSCPQDGGSLSNDGRSLRLYAPMVARASEAGRIVFAVVHERFSLSKGVSHHPMLLGALPLAPLLEEAEGPGQAVRQVRVPLHALDGGDQVLGELDVDVGVHLHVLRRVGPPSPRPPAPELRDWDVDWLQDFVFRLERDLELVHQSVENCERALAPAAQLADTREGWLTGTRHEELAESSDDGEGGPQGGVAAAQPAQSVFKSSALKKDPRVAGVPTNLHVSLFAFENSNVEEPSALAEEVDLLSFSPLDDATAAVNTRKRDKLQVYATVTSGIPSAHCLGLSPGSSMSELEHELNQKSNMLPGFSPTTPSTRAPNAAIDLCQQLADLERRLFIRKTLVCAQGLGIFVTSFLTEIQVRLAGVHNRTNKNMPEPLWGAQLQECGFFFGMESLVSAHGKELTMLKDCIGFINWIQRCKIRLCSATPGAPSANPFDRLAPSAPQVRLEASSRAEVPLEIVVTLDAGQLAQLGLCPGTNHEIAIAAAVFTQGINEMQTLANVKSRISSGRSRDSHAQRDLNLGGLATVKRYAGRLLAFLTQSAPAASAKAQARTVKAVVTHMNAVMQRQQVHLKDTEILNVAEDTFRVLSGGLVTFCKSGKDRTAMAVTLAQARALLDVPLLGCPEGGGEPAGQGEGLLWAANVFREYGVRLYVAEKNTGRPLYSFNAFQRKTLPALYRPPVSTIQDIITSVVARDS